MTVIAVPAALKMAVVDRRLVVAAGVTRSPFTLATQVQDWGGRCWEYDLRFATSAEAEGKALSAFFAALCGPVNSFVLPEPSASPADTGTGVTVAGADQTGTSLDTEGWDGPGLVAGDFFSLGTGSDTRLYQLTADAVPASGACTLHFVPPLRSSPADAAVVEIAAPKVVLRATAVLPTAIATDRTFSFTGTFREAI